MQKHYILKFSYDVMLKYICAQKKMLQRIKK
jgi:hypothetical protein